MAACEYYIDAIDTDWYALAPWYRAMLKYRNIVDPATLCEPVELVLMDVGLRTLPGSIAIRDLLLTWSRGCYSWPNRQSH